MASQCQRASQRCAGRWSSSSCSAVLAELTRVQEASYLFLFRCYSFGVYGGSSNSANAEVTDRRVRLSQVLAIQLTVLTNTVKQEDSSGS